MRFALCIAASDFGSVTVGTLTLSSRTSVGKAIWRSKRPVVALTHASPLRSPIRSSFDRRSSDEKPNHARSATATPIAY
jgi:hypothetical protein